MFGGLPRRSGQGVHAGARTAARANVVGRARSAVNSDLLDLRLQSPASAPLSGRSTRQAAEADRFADRPAVDVWHDGRMLVWLTSWQLAEEHLLITVGDTVEWDLYPADKEWISRLFAERLTIDWQFDTYGGAVDRPSRHVIGKVTAVHRVRCREIHADGSFVPARGEATLQGVVDTSSSWRDYELKSKDVVASHSERAAITGGSTKPGVVDQYGYVLSLDLSYERSTAEDTSTGPEGNTGDR